jgi:hypothetical protein
LTIIILYGNLSLNNNREAEMLENVETKEIRNACIALSPLNKKRVYEVASALQFAEKRPNRAAGAGFVENGDRRRHMKTGNKE